MLDASSPCLFLIIKTPPSHRRLSDFFLSKPIPSTPILIQDYLKLTIKRNHLSCLTRTPLTPTLPLVAVHHLSLPMRWRAPVPIAKYVCPSNQRSLSRICPLNKLAFKGNSYDTRSQPAGDAYHYSNRGMSMVSRQCQRSLRWLYFPHRWQLLLPVTTPKSPPSVLRASTNTLFHRNGDGSKYHSGSSGNTYTAPDGNVYKK